MEERSLSKGGLLKAVFCVICSILLAVTLMPSGAYAASGDAVATDATGDQDVSLLADDAETSTWDGSSVETSWYDASKTEFTLTSAAQLAGLAAISSGLVSGITLDTFEGKTVKLGVDIDLNNEVWTPISDVNLSSSALWQGTFDGCGHIIANLNASGKEDGNSAQLGGRQGFIAEIGVGAVVRNVGISGSVTGRIAGGIVGDTKVEDEDTKTISIYEWPRIENCWANVKVHGDGSGTRPSGGIFGGYTGGTGMYCHIINCHSSGSVESGGSAPIGGLAGGCAGIVAGSYSTCSLSGIDRFGGNVATMYMKDYVSSSFTSQGTYVNNLTTTSPAYRYYTGSSGDGGDPATSDEGVCTAEELASDEALATLGLSAWVKGTDAPQLYWEAGYSDIDISGAKVTKNSDNTVTVTLGDKTLVEDSDYFAVTESGATKVYGIGRYTGVAEGISTWDGSIDTSWYDPDGTEFTLYSAQQLAALADITSPDCSKAESLDAVVGETESRAEGIKLDNFEGKTVKLAVDVDLKKIQWNPISDFNNWGHGGQSTSDGTFNGVYWQGTFDGGGHVIVNMSDDGRINCSENYYGYQGFISGIGIGGLVRNLGVQGTMYARVGGGIVAASNFDETETVNMELNEWPRVENCWTNVGIEGNGSSTRGCAGIFGGEAERRAMCNVINCYSQGSVSNTNAGGISGQTNGIVAGCYSTATVTAKGSDMGSITSNLYVPSYFQANYKAIGVFEHNIGLSSPVYRYTDASNNAQNSDYPAFSTDYLKTDDALSTLGDAWVEGDAANGHPYPRLYWEAGESDIDLSDATVEVAGDGTVTVTLGNDILTEYTDYVVVTDGLTTTVYGVGRYTGSAQYKEDVYFTVNTQIAGSDEVPTVAKEFSKADFEALVPADSKDNPVSGLYGTGSWSVASTDYYVTLSDIYESAGINKDEVVELNLNNNVTLTAQELKDQSWFYPKATNDESSSSEEAIEVPAVFALTSASAALGDNQTAEAVQADNLKNANDDGAPRFINGISESQFASKTASEDRLLSECTSITVTIGGKSIEGAEVTVSEGDYVYTGSAITPDVSVTLDGNPLTAGTDYTLSYSDNVNAGPATVTVTGAGNYTGTATGTFTIAPANITVCTIAAIGDVKATGDPIEPELTINDNRFASLGQTGPALVLNSDYTAEYADNIDIGSTATVTIKGIGNYQGETTTTFDIIPYFTVYSQEGGDTYDDPALRQVAKEYNQTELETKVARDGRDPVSGMFYQSAWRVTSTDYYVTIADLFSDARLTWRSGTTLSYGGEGESYSYSFEEITAQDKFFPDAAGTASLSPENSVAAPAVLAITNCSTTTGTTTSDGTVITTAQDAEDYNIKWISENPEGARDNEPRIIYGITQEGYISLDNVAGRRYWSRCDHVTLNVEIYDVSVEPTENGTVEVDKTKAKAGDTVTITGKPATGYEIDDVAIKDASGDDVAYNDEGDGTYTFTMPASDVDVNVTFTAATPEEHKIDVKENTGGSVSVPSEAEAGETVTVTVTADEGFAIATFSIRDASGNPVTYKDNGDGTYTFTMPDSEVTVDVTFSAVTPEKITITSDMFDVDTSYAIYDGAAITKTITSDLKLGTDYTVTYANNAAPGTATITITGIGNYEGTLTYTFKIIRCFEDVGATKDSVNEWYFDAVYGMVDFGVITGYSQTIFGVGDAMSRAQLVTVLWRYCEPDQYKNYNESTATNTTSLPDNPAGMYYTGAVNWAVEAGVITGNRHEDGSYTFNPDDPVTFDQMVTILARYCLGSFDAAANYNTSSLDNGNFTDKGTVEDYARGSMAWAIDNKVVTGNENVDGTWTLNPLENVARERAVTVVYRSIEDGLFKQS